MTAAVTLSKKEARPFVKMAGGKTQLLPELRKHVPEKFGRYFEPFVGGGALFFDLAAARRLTNKAVLVDTNELLIKCYRAIQSELPALFTWLHSYEDTYLKGSPSERSTFFYVIREALGSRTAPLANEAARAIFLNKTCFNGLWRVNSKGGFNVPHGRYANPAICDEENLRAVSAVLQGARILSQDFQFGYGHPLSPVCDDFCYFDPPYWPVSKTADFTGYSKGGFGPDDQERLRDIAVNLKERGVRVLLSNADVEPVRKLYAKGFEMRRVEARRAVNSDPSKRGPVGELIIW